MYICILKLVFCFENMSWIQFSFLNSFTSIFFFFFNLNNKSNKNCWDFCLKTRNYFNDVRKTSSLDTIYKKTVTQINWCFNFQQQQQKHLNTLKMYFCILKLVFREYILKLGSFHRENTVCNSGKKKIQYTKLVS